MLNKYKDLQQGKLDELSLQRSHINDRLTGQQQQLSQLQQYQQNLTNVSSLTDALSLQNQHTMSKQVEKLVDFQQQQLSLTQVDLNRQNVLIKQQFCHYKGLESISRKKEAIAEQKSLQQEQFSNDEIATQAFLRQKN